MLKLLIRKQILEIYKSYFYDAKKNKPRSAVSTACYIILFAFLMIGVLGGIFAGLSFALCSPLVSVDMGWLYYLIMTVLAVFLGALGSIFNTYSGLYLAKDNDLLLSLPIPIRTLIASRLITVYIMGAMYAAVVFIPAIIVYFLMAKPSPGAILGALLLLVLISVIVLILSCLLGFLVAKISLKLKHKSIVLVVVTLFWVLAYYYFCVRARSVFADFTAHAVAYGAKIKGSAYILYLFGRVGEGDPVAVLFSVLIVGVCLGITWLLLSRSFLGIATASAKNGFVRHQTGRLRRKSVFIALLGKEFGRFTSSANYMLNCGLGTLVMLIVAVLMMIKGKFASELLSQIFQSTDFIAMLVICGVCMLSSMNDMTAPSISLEGKNLWLLQSLPISSWQVLKAKISMQLILTNIPLLVCSVCAWFVFDFGLCSGIFLLLIPQLYAVLFALFGLSLNLKNPSFTWTSEIAPLKQSLPPVLVILCGWAYGLLLIAGYYLLGDLIPVVFYMFGVAFLTGGLSGILIFWLKKKGTVIFKSLS